MTIQVHVSRRRSLAMFSLVVAALAAGCGSTDYRPEGRGDVVQGKGGTATVVDGMEIWDADGPPRRYRVLGRIDDQQGSGVLPLINRQQRVVRLARETGGTALIHLRDEREFAGYHVLGSGAAADSGRGPALGPAPAVPMTRRASVFLVIRYVD